MPFVRHLAICVAAAAAWVLRVDLQIGRELLWVIGAAALLNFVTYAGTASPWRTGRHLCSVASPIFAILGWGAIVHLTGGVQSPFVAGLWIEILLAALSQSVIGTLFVSAGTIVVLVAQEGILGFDYPVTLLVHVGSLASMGTIATLFVRHGRAARDSLSTGYAALEARLRDLQRRLENADAVAEVGRHSARLSHGLKNGIHALRGFTSLLEGRLKDRPGAEGALKGLAGLADQLETLALETLGRGTGSSGSPGMDGDLLRRTVREATREALLGQPGVRCQVHYPRHIPGVDLPAVVLREVLVNLLRNAAEAMNGQGNVTVGVRSADGERLALSISDEGPGIPAAELDAIFEPGYTTKPGGSGFGLFIARMLLASHGARLEASSAEGGATFSMILPLRTGAGHEDTIHTGR